MEHNADLNVKEKFGWTAYMLASNNRHEEVMQIISSEAERINRTTGIGELTLKCKTFGTI